MNMISVSSSNIHSVGYEQRTLYVQFRSGGLYSYSGVPEEVYRALLTAPSHGQYFSTYIKHTYSCQRVR